MVLFLYIVAVVAATVGPDYQLYTNSIGNEFNRVHFPLDESQTVWKINSNCSFGPLMTVGDEWDEFDIQYLPRADISIEKYFGNKEVHPFVALQASTELNIGQMPQQPILQAANVVAGLSVAPAELFRASAAVVTGSGFTSKEDVIGLIASAGLSRERFGIAGSYARENVRDNSSPYKVSAGVFYQRDQTRLIFEYDKQFDDEYEPAEISIGMRISREVNHRNVFLSSSFASNTSSAAGAGPRISLGLTFNLEKNKRQNFSKKEDEQIAEITPVEEPEGSKPAGVGYEVSAPIEEPEDSKPSGVGYEVSAPIEEPEGSKPAGVGKDVSSANETVLEETKPKKLPKEIGILEKPQEKLSARINSKNDSSLEEKEPMSNDTTTLVAQEVQPTAPTPQNLANIAQQSGGDSSLAMVLAILAVVGGGAAWKFYSQYSEQKHEQKMKEMELQAKANGLGAASPPPCQTAQAEMKAEIKALKTKVAGTAALLEDVDFDLYDRKFKKLDKRIKELEDPDND